MLKDRRLLLEQEIKKAREEAAAIYLDIVTHDLDVHNDKYEFIKNKIVRLEFDLNMVTQLIHNGHK